jgi:hypothetical protein
MLKRNRGNFWDIWKISYWVLWLPRNFQSPRLGRWGCQASLYALGISKAPLCLVKLKSWMCSFYLSFYWGEVLGFELRAYTLNHSISPFWGWVFFFFFERGSCELFAWGWLQTMILLMSASQVARIIGVSHQRPACYLFFGGISHILKLKLDRFIGLDWGKIRRKIKITILLYLPDPEGKHPWFFQGDLNVKTHLH